MVNTWKILEVSIVNQWLTRIQYGKEFLGMIEFLGLIESLRLIKSLGLREPKLSTIGVRKLIKLTYL